MEPGTLSEMQIDALREVGSIGAGHAATALSQLAGTAVDIEVPVARLLPVTEVPGVFGGPENLVGAVYGRLLGELRGALLFILPRADLLALADVLRSREPGTAKSLGADEEALVVHAAGVLQAAYAAAIGRFTGLSALPAAPEFAFDMVGAILEAISSGVSLKAETAILITTKFRTEGADIDAALFFLLDPESLDVVLGHLGMV
jgi:chemotaxis protein CheC